MLENKAGIQQLYIVVCEISLESHNEFCEPFN